MLPWCLIHPSRVLLAESSNIRYTQCFYITAYPFLSLLYALVVPCVHPTFFSFQEGFKNQTLSLQPGSRDVEVGLSMQNKFFHYQLSLELFSPFPSPAGGHPDICQVHFVGLAAGVGVLALGPCFPGKAGGCRSSSRLHQAPLLVILDFQSFWFL